MLSFIRHMFRPAPELSTEIPRYPPFAKGLPSVKEDRLLTTQQELVDKLRQALPFDRRQFDELMLPVIRRYAAFVHLLPASEAHHHRGAGGLLHHGLEVALIAARSSEDVMFAANQEPRRRRELEPRWRLAVCLAGLTHDVGKPVSDLSVTDSTGEHVWNAYTENLADWTEREAVDRYFLHWHKGRHRRHEQFSVLVMERVLTRECLNWLSRYGPEIPHALLNSVAMADDDHNDIGPLIRRADNTSVERDMRRYQAPPNESLGVPVERYIIDAMRRLIGQGKWQANEKGSRVWVLTDGLHIVWPAAAHEITRVLQRDNVPGVPRDPDSIADILIDRGLAQPRQTESTTYRYWPMRPELFGDSDPSRLMMLRLSAPDLLFSEPPPPIAAELIESRPKPKTKDMSDQDSGDSASQPAKAPPKKHRSEPIMADSPADEALAAAAARPAETQTTPADEPEAAEETSPDDQLAASIPHLIDEDDPITAASEPQSAAQEASDSSAIAQSHPDSGQVEQLAAKRTSKRRGGRRKAQRQDNAHDSTASEPGPARAKMDFGAGQAEPILQSLYADGQWEVHLFNRQDQVLVAYPDGAGLGGSPTDVQRILADEGLLKTDPLSPMLKVRTVDGIKGLLLTPRISALFLDSGGNTAQNRTEDAAQDSSRSEPRSEPETRPDAEPSSQPKEQQPDKPDGPTKVPERPDGKRPAAGKATKTRTKTKPSPKSEQTEGDALAPQSDQEPRGGDTAAPNSTKLGPAPDHTTQGVAQGLIDIIRDPDSKLPCRRERSDGWIYVSQAVIQWYASTQEKAPSAMVRGAASSHPDIALEGNSRIAIKESANV